MIVTRWCDRLTDQELAQVQALVKVAAAYDEEAEFSSMTLDSTPSDTRYLLVYPEPDGELSSEFTIDGLIACLRMSTDEGGDTGLVECVVHPSARSRGVATLMLERVGAAPIEQWAPAGLRALSAQAQGAHPAADRMSRRFGATVTAHTYKLIRPLIEAEHGLVHLSPQDRQRWSESAQTEPDGTTVLVLTDTTAADLGVRLRITGNEAQLTLLMADPARDPAGTRAALTVALHALDARGLERAVLAVSADEELLITAARSVGFEHERSDIRYAVPLPLRVVRR